MVELNKWLLEAYKKILPGLPGYTEQLAALEKLQGTTFIEGQKVRYKYIGLHALLAPLLSESYRRLPGDYNRAQAIEGDSRFLCRKGPSMRLTFMDGVWTQSATTPYMLAPGIQLSKLSDLSLEVQAEMVHAYLPDLASDEELFAQLHILLAQETYILEIRPDIKQTIEIQNIITRSAAHVASQLIVKIDQRSEVTLIEQWHAVDETAKNFVYNLMHITLEASAQLTYYTLHTAPVAFHQVTTLYCHQKAHSLFSHYTCTLSTSILRINLKIYIEEQGANALLYGLYCLAEREKVDHAIDVIHSCPHGLSKQHYKGMLGGQSMAVFNGKIFVTPVAQQTNAYQTNQVMLLSDEAHHYTQPQLEIYADDVKCSHGATMGQLDEMQLFYMQTRGIEKTLARRLLLEAFGDEIIQSISEQKDLKKFLSDRLMEKLAKL